MTPNVSTDAVPNRATKPLWMLGSLAMLFIGGLTLTRLLFEWQFPDWLWLGRPLAALSTAALLAAAVGVAGRSFWSAPAGTLTLLPLSLNLLYLSQPVVDLAASRVLFWGSLWLVAVLLIWVRVPDAADSRWRWLGPLFIFLALTPAYLLSMSHAVGAADTFEFQVVAPRLGIAHPTGYPLYLLLAKVSSLLPIGSVAWRVNLASAVFAVASAIVIYSLARRLVTQPLAALVGAVVWGLVPGVWSQAIVAEVYTLHALIVAVALWLMVSLIEIDASVHSVRTRRLAIALMFTMGLGLTNHLTTVFLLPPAALTGLFLISDRHRTSGHRLQIDWRFLITLMVAFALPLLLYLYLPVRWQAVNGEPMGLARFVDWVAGGRFQGALQWMSWLRDPARYEIVGRLVYDAWGWFFLLWAGAGVVFMWLRQRRALLILALTAAGYTFYALNYYVPDLAVFLLPVHVVIAIWLAGGVAAVIEIGKRTLSRTISNEVVVAGLVFLLACLPVIVTTSKAWHVRDQSAQDGGETWARGVLKQPLDANAAILADSEKIAPLYYLQQIEGLRPDLDIMVLPDEAAYRAELDQRTAAGQTVYLARFLPALAGSYHLHSAGPLLQADPLATDQLPEGVTPLDRIVGPLRLKGAITESVAAEDPTSASVTLYWTQDRPLAAGEELPVIYLRWSSDLYPLESQPLGGQHAAGDSYPINAWQPGEIVADYHTLPVPVFDCPNASTGCMLDVWVAVGPRFANSDELVWTPATSVAVMPPWGPMNGQVIRAQIDTWLLDGVGYPAQIRPQTAFTVYLSGWGEGAPPDLQLLGEDMLPVRKETGPLPPQPPTEGPSRQSAVSVPGVAEPGIYTLWAESPSGGMARCGWLAPVTTGCVLGEVDVSHAVLPEGATNFADKIALLNVDLSQIELQPGGQLPLTITWQGLAPIAEDYTVFVQVLDTNDRLVGQVDSWPVQGTFPTSQWTPGAAVRDPYVIQLSDDLPPGQYKLNIGLYLLGTLQRLPVISTSGNIVDDKLEIGGLTVLP